MELYSWSSSFLVQDYVVFVVFLLISLLIGVFFAFQSCRRQRRNHDDVMQDNRRHDFNGDGKTAGRTNEFLLGNRNMPMLPVSLSILASFLSANTVMGTPGVIYQYGLIYWFFCLHNFISIPIAAHVFIPIFHDLRLTSVYEYLQLRFSLAVRLVAAAIYVVQMLFYMAVVLYSPAIALQGVTGIETWISVVSTGIVCTSYTVMGGLKAVVWTDVFQMVVVYAGLITMLVRGASLYDGFGEIWTVATEGLRVNIAQFDPDPTVEYTIWSTIVGGAFTALTVYVSNQALVQRYLSLKHRRQAQIALYLNGPLLILVISITSFLGLVIFKRFRYCDPLVASSDSVLKLKSADELMASMIPETLGSLLPGLSGLFVACVFSASISTISSGVNSLAAICVEDFMKPLFNSLMSKSPSDEVTLRTSRILALVFGVMTIGFALFVGKLGGSVVVLALTVFGLCGGPLLGLFVQGVLCPWIDAVGAFFGVVASFLILIFIKTGALLNQYRASKLDTSIEGCSSLNATTSMPTDNNFTIVPSFSTFISSRSTITTSDNGGTANGSNATDTSVDAIFPLFRVSFFWYALIAVLVSVIVGSFVSLIVGLFRRRPREKIPSNLVSPFWRGSRYTCSPAKRRLLVLVRKGRDNEGIDDEGDDDEMTKL